MIIAIAISMVSVYRTQTVPSFPITPPPITPPPQQLSGAFNTAFSNAFDRLEII